MQVIKNVQKVGDEEVTILIEPLREIKKGYDYGEQRAGAIEELAGAFNRPYGAPHHREPRGPRARARGYSQSSLRDSRKGPVNHSISRWAAFVLSLRGAKHVHA